MKAHLFANALSKRLPLIASVLAGLCLANCLITVPALDEEVFGGALHLADTTEDMTLQNTLLLAAASSPNASPEINIRESGISYLSGSTFSFAGRGSGQLPFTVENTGTAPLLLGTLSSSNVVDYTITQPLSLVIPPGGTTTFTAGNTSGGNSTMLTITSNDADESTYTINTLTCGC